MMRRLILTLLVASTGCGPSQKSPKVDNPTAPDSPDAGVVDAAVAEALPDAAPPPMLISTAPPMGTGSLGPDAVVAARVFAFADTQLHYIYGKRTFAQSPYADRMAFEVAIRPAALDDGSDLLLESFLTEYGRYYRNHSMVFLGDASDVSCTHEFDAFSAVLAQHGLNKLLGVTSNHDGFFVGNFTSKEDVGGNLALTDMPNDWTRACSVPGSFRDYRLTKGRAVKRLSELLPQGPLWATSSSFRGATGPNQYKNSHLYYVRRLEGGDPGAPPAWGVFLDTVDYRDFDLNAAKGAGSVGSVSRKQLRFLDHAMFEAAGKSADDPVFVLFAHHPFDDLDNASRERLRAFIASRDDIAAYVSAHTHESGERNIRLGRGKELSEIVVGSTTDAPQSARSLEIQVSKNGRARAVANHRLDLDTETLCEDVDKLPPTSLGYTGYRIRRDSTPDVEVGFIDKLSFAIGLSDLVEQRLTQAVGALVVENELVRALAELYLLAPIDRSASETAQLRALAQTRYASGNSRANVRPWLDGTAKAGKLTQYDEWNDPVMSSVLKIAEQGVHRFGPRNALFSSLRDRRKQSPESSQYFFCHAVYAAAAEARRARRRGNVVYIR